MFKFLVNDGVADSASATVTVDINLPPVPEVDPIASGWSTSIPGAFELNFSGGTDATYSAYASTNLLDWEWLGFAEPVSAGVYLYLDSEATNAPQRFYKVGAP